MPPYMRPVELAAYLGISPKTIAAYRLEGGGPEYISVSRRCVLYSAESVEKWLNSRKRASTSGTPAAA
jgi:hypothetical protein